MGEIACPYCQSREPCFDGKSAAGFPCQYPNFHKEKLMQNKRPTIAELEEILNKPNQPRVVINPDGSISAVKTLAQQVDDLACRAIRLEGLAREMLVTIKLNVERGYIVAHNDEGKLNLEKIVASWSKQLAEIG